MIPSLLFGDKPGTRTRHEPELMQNIRLDALFGGQTLELLSFPCTPEEILARQSLFERLNDPAFRGSFFQLSEALSYVYQAYKMYESARNDCERCLSFYSYASRYLDAVALILSIEVHGSFFAAFEHYRRELLPLREELERALSDLKAPIFDLLTSRAFLSPIGVFVGADAPSDGLMAQLLACAGDLGLYDLSLPSQRSVDLPAALAQAIFALYPEQFARCQALIGRFSDRLDPEICEYRFQIAFYKSVWELVSRAQEVNIPHCVPALSNTPLFQCREAYDATLIAKNETAVVPNDIDFHTDESFYFLTGANGGGKTTYLRACAVNLVLALAGCPVFARSASVFPFDFVGSHFPHDEVRETGRLFEEKERVERLFEVGEHPFLFFNETFSGASEQKGLVLTLDCAERCKNEHVFGLFVTHFHEVNGHGFSVLSTLMDKTDHTRSYKIGKNTGLRTSFAEDILRKYRLDAQSLIERRSEI